MGRWLSLLLAGLLLLSGCGFSRWQLPFRQDKPRFAVVDWDRLVEQHPKYKEWQRRKEQLETAKWLRERQKENGQQQLALLGQMKKVREAGKGQFQSAQWSAQVAEKRAQEQDLLRKKRAALEEEAESRVKADRDAVEEKYRIPLFNLRLKLSSVKMSDEAQKALLQEQQELLDKRQKDRADVEAEKEQWLQQQMAADVAASQARLQAFSKELAGQVVQEQTGLSLTGKTPQDQEGQPELDKLLQSMDKEIQQQEDKEKQMREEIDSDILSAIKKVNLSRKYTLIFRNPRANISADDITDEVNTVVQQIVY
ncbi:outer membrane chaperone Skp [Acidaminococcus fermentans]|uniref:outer membrane chaperone Skp n=1 Tax=Acidaminococcus fermentans TaxID=905 RepID=UPI0028048E91|nr:outer membrane chaperone Skp [Acidaminococcus fermentans]MEE1599127.1 outer membrane chaperone Skp [Acidaminococcus fermentans]MEE4123389.1 outer membrane chaperone Skp [Acidaminococcus fermentans]